jgi:hypothetical protein
MQALHQRIYQMSKFIKLLVIPVLLFHQLIFSNNIAISLDSGYCWGATWLGIQNYQTSDSINFSTQLSLKIIPSPENIPVGGTAGLSYFLVLLTNSYQKIGYKFDHQISRGPYIAYPDYSTLSINNPDTFWNSVNKFPDSLLILDSLNIYNKDTFSYSLGIGKWCFNNSGADIDFGCYYTYTLKNYNAIIYAQYNYNRKMKLQIDNFHQGIVKTYSPNHPCGPVNYQIDSVHILWAADSMGNGIFKHPPVGVMEQGRREYPEYSQAFERINIQSGASSVEFSLPAKSGPINSLKIYSLNGSLVNQWQNPGRSVSWQTNGVMAGVYVAEVQFQNPSHLWSVFVIKR